MSNPSRIRLCVCGTAAAILLAGGWLASTAADAKKSEFARGTIDLGMVVSNVKESVKFYTEAIGFKEVPGFTVGADFCADAGLTDQKLDIHVLVLDDGETATKLKLMAVPGVKMQTSNTRFITSQLGYRYLTIYVADADAALARLNRAGVKPLAKGPVPLPPDFPKGMALTVVRDPDGNMVELIGPVH